MLAEGYKRDEIVRGKGEGKEERRCTCSCYTQETDVCCGQGSTLLSALAFPNKASSAQCWCCVVGPHQDPINYAATRRSAPLRCNARTRTLYSTPPSPLPLSTLSYPYSSPISHDSEMYGKEQKLYSSQIYVALSRLFFAVCHSGAFIQTINLSFSC